MDRCCRSIARIGQDIVSNALGSAAALSTLAHETTMAFAALIADARRSMAVTPDDDEVCVVVGVVGGGGGLRGLFVCLLVFFVVFLFCCGSWLLCISFQLPGLV